MKILIKILTTSVITALFITSLLIKEKDLKRDSECISLRQSVKVSFISKDLTDDYLVFIRENLEEIQKNNEGKVEFSFYDSKSDLDKQNENIDAVLNEGTNLVLLDIVDTRFAQDVINKVKQYNLPIILFNREPLTMDPIISYKKALYIGTDSKQAGTIQGNILMNEWNKNKEYVDKNKDDKLQYIILQGERYNKVPLERTKYAILTLEQAGVKIEELALRVCDWNSEIANDTTEALLLKYGDKIETIISNDDTMAFGAIEALQSYGYNKGEISKTIPVVGVDGVPKAIELISEGIMLGTAVQDPKDMAEALYTIGLNMVENRDPLNGTKYNFDETGRAVRIPFQEYTGKEVLRNKK